MYGNKAESDVTLVNLSLISVNELCLSHVDCVTQFLLAVTMAFEFVWLIKCFASAFGDLLQNCVVANILFAHNAT